MVEHFQDLDLAVEWILEKATKDPTTHTLAALLENQDDYDKHVEALGHHASAIEHYREKPEVKRWLEAAGKLIPHRAYIKKPIKLTNKAAPQLEVGDLNEEHPEIKSLSPENRQKRVDALNNAIKSLHSELHEKGADGEAKNKALKALHSHSDRFLHHFAELSKLHGLQREGKIPHAKFAGALEAPEITDRPARIKDSKYRGSSSTAQGLTTQSISKAGGAMWDPGLPELTSLEEKHEHPSIGKPKELYPFREIKVNGKPIPMKKFGDKDPEEIHDADYRVGLPHSRQVKTPSGAVGAGMGVHSGAKTGDKKIEHMGRLEVFKKSDEDAPCSYFPDTTLAHVVLAKNLIEVLNPYAGMTDEEFGDYIAASLYKSLGPSEQAAILAESLNRLEKAKKDLASKYKITQSEHAKGVEDVLGGNVTPLPLPDETDAELLGSEVPKPRTQKPDEKRDELQDIEGVMGSEMKRSPYAVPKEVFTDDTYSKVDPEKFKTYVNGRMQPHEIRQQIAAYKGAIRHNPEAQKRHKDYVEAHREIARPGIQRILHGTGEAPKAEHTPEATHAQALQDAGAWLAANKDKPGAAAKFAEMMARANATKSKNRGTKSAGEDQLTPEEKEVKEQDPSYKVSRPSAKQKAEQRSEQEMSDIAHGKRSSYQEAAGAGGDDSDSKGDDDDYETAQERGIAAGEGARHEAEIVGGGKGKEGEETSARSGEKIQLQTPDQLVSSHPGFRAYLQMREKLLSHYKNPAVRKYMEDKLLQHENNPNLDVDKLAATYHFLHRSQKQAAKAGEGQAKLLKDVVKEKGQADAGSEEDAGPVGTGSAMQPETMMTPEQRQRFGQVKDEKAQQVAAAPAAPAPKAEGLKTADPEYKKKLMAELQAREDAKKPKAPK